MSDTPRTDAALKRYEVGESATLPEECGVYVPADFVRQLERELNEAMRELRYAKDGESTARKISHAAQIERDLLQEKLLKAENERDQLLKIASSCRIRL